MGKKRRKLEDFAEECPDPLPIYKNGTRPWQDKLKAVDPQGVEKLRQNVIDWHHGAALRSKFPTKMIFGNALAAYLKKEYGIEISGRTMERWLAAVIGGLA